MRTFKASRERRRKKGSWVDKLPQTDFTGDAGDVRARVGIGELPFEKQDIPAGFRGFRNHVTYENTQSWLINNIDQIYGVLPNVLPIITQKTNLNLLPYRHAFNYKDILGESVFDTKRTYYMAGNIFLAIFIHGSKFSTNFVVKVGNGPVDYGYLVIELNSKLMNVDITQLLSIISGGRANPRDQTWIEITGTLKGKVFNEPLGHQKY